MAAHHAPEIGRGQNASPILLRHRHEIETLRALGKVGKRVDDLTGGASPVIDALIHGRQRIRRDFVHQAGHCRADDALCHILYRQGQVDVVELEINALDLIDHQRDLALDHILQCHHLTGPNGEISRAANRDGAAHLVPIDPVREFRLVRAVHPLEDTKLVLQHRERNLCDHVRG